jgi:imidazolonepropionase-like amidohydrolase
MIRPSLSHRMLIGVLAGAMLAPAALVAQQDAADSYVIRNATIVPVVGARIENGTIVIRDGRIVAVGAGVQAPAGARVVDAQGLYVYPGLIDSGTQLGLTEISSIPGPEDTREVGDMHPQNVSLTAVNPHSELIPVTRVNGVTTVITSGTGGLVSGQASLMDLTGWTPAEMGVKQGAAMVFSYPATGGGVGRFGFAFGPQRSEAEMTRERDRRVSQIYDALHAAKAYGDSRDRGATGNVNHAHAALVPVVRGEMPALFDVETADQMRGVLAMADTFGLKVIFRGAHEAWMLADTLAARNIPVIVGPTTTQPGLEDPYDMIYANAGVLARAGVLVAFQTNDASNARNLPYNVALATAHGLDPEEALRTMTINPARIWGVDDLYGSIEVGKVANLVITDGDPLDVRTNVRHLFIRGSAMPMTDRHTRLYEQFRARPRQTQ